MNRTEIILLVEEAHLHTTRQRMMRYDQGEPIIVRMLRTGRKHAISIFVLDQTPSELPTAVLGNLATRIVFRLTNEPCANAISSSMGLNREQHKELVELPLRRAIVQTAGNPRPFLMHVVEIPERYRPPEDELLERERQSLAMLDYEMPETDATEILYGGGKEEPRFEIRAIRGDMHRVLTAVCEAPATVIVDRCDRIGIERAKEYRARQNLIKLGMIETADKVGSKWQLYAPTAKGREWARSMGLRVPEFKSGIGHEFMVIKVREALARSFRDIEFFAPGKSLGVIGLQPDLLAGMSRQEKESGWRMAIQVSSTNKSTYEVDRAIALAGVEQIDLVVVVAKNKTTRKRIERRFKERRGGEGSLWSESGRRKDAQKDAGKGLQGEVHFQQRAGCIKITDFETCINPDYDWSWVME